jgi:hypothetical protein
MTLIPDFKQKFPKLWSVRLGALAGLLSGIEVVLPFFETSIPKGWFAIASFIAAVAGVIARAVVQKELHGEE